MLSPFNRRVSAIWSVHHQGQTHRLYHQPCSSSSFSFGSLTCTSSSVSAQATALDHQTLEGAGHRAPPGEGEEHQECQDLGGKGKSFKIRGERGVGHNHTWWGRWRWRTTPWSGRRRRGRGRGTTWRWRRRWATTTTTTATTTTGPTRSTSSSSRSSDQLQRREALVSRKVTLMCTRAHVNTACRMHSKNSNSTSCMPSSPHPGSIKPLFPLNLILRPQSHP